MVCSCYSLWVDIKDKVNRIYLAWALSYISGLKVISLTKFYLLELTIEAIAYIPFVVIKHSGPIILLSYPSLQFVGSYVD